MVRLALAVMFFCSACQSKPVRTPNEQSAPSVKATEKVTNAPAQPGLEVFIRVEFGPRRTQEIELGLLKSGIKSCLINYIAADNSPLIVTMEGKFNYQGQMQELKVDGDDKDLVECFKQEAASVNIGRGRIGPFKLQVATGPELLKGVKGLQIRPSEPKKLE